MMKSIFQATALSLVASLLASCALAQAPARMLQAIGRTAKLGDNQHAPAALPIQQREIEDSRLPIGTKPQPAEMKMENQIAAGTESSANPAADPS